MRMSELVGKEIININDGLKMGMVGDSDLVINPESGEIESIILPNRGNLINLWIDRQKLVVPWEAVKKIGREVIVVDLDHTNPRLHNYSY
ncbi:MAG: YlmC/YmxH family sporulation protein [Syntrophomonadaceae bacterium]|nr:YlmC/YmxH family sporulation protein [Syntrophomonadaceae bacterium]